MWIVHPNAVSRAPDEMIGVIHRKVLWFATSYDDKLIQRSLIDADGRLGPESIFTYDYNYRDAGELVGKRNSKRRSNANTQKESKEKRKRLRTMGPPDLSNSVLHEPDQTGLPPHSLHTLLLSTSDNRSFIA